MAERLIEGIGEVRVEPIPAMRAIKLYADLMRVVGKASHRLPAIIVGFTSAEPIANGAAEINSVQAIIDILSETSSAEIAGLVKELVEIGRVRAPSGEMRSLDVDGDFTGKLAALLPTVRFVIEVQFRDFFSASVGSGLREMIRQASRPAS